jgi:hypothetical protein
MKRIVVIPSNYQRDLGKTGNGFLTKKSGKSLPRRVLQLETFVIHERLKRNVEC